MEGQPLTLGGGARLSRGRGARSPAPTPRGARREARSARGDPADDIDRLENLLS